jgi:hypothetical protein
MLNRTIVFLAAPLLSVLLMSVAIAQGPSWLGRYEFSEDGGKTAGGTGIFIEHEIEITDGDEGLIAFIKSNGYQTSVDLVATAKVTGSRLEIYFQNYGDDNMFESYGSGDLLLTLERKTVRGKSLLLTYWGKFTPAIEKNGSTGKVYFKKSEPLRK